MKLNRSIENLLRDENVLKAANSASYSYRSSLSPSEIENCIKRAIWKASENFNENGGSKFTSYLHTGVSHECANAVRFNKSPFRSLDKSKNAYNISGRYNDFERVDMMDEISNCGDPKLVYDRFYLNKSYRELAEERNVSGELIRIRLEKCLKKIKNSFND